MTDLNTYVDSNRRHFTQGNDIKQMETERVAWACIEQKIPVFTQKVHIFYTFYMDNNKQDEDNLLIYIKYINDGLVNAKRIKSDGKKWLHIMGITFAEEVGVAKTIIDIYEDGEEKNVSKNIPSYN